MDKILSISVAAYNVETYITELLDDLIRCNVREKLEVLVIDDGATDSTYGIACRYMDNYPGIVKAIHKENGGWGSTVNTGIRLATGRYFKLLDGDDLYDSDNLDRLVAYLERCSSDVVLSPYTRFFDNTSETEVPQNPLFSGTLPREIELDELPVTPFPLEMYSVAFRTEVIKDAGIRITEHSFYTDNEFVAKCMNRCATCSIVPYNVYRYRVGRAGQSVSMEGMRKHYREFETILRSMLLFTRDEIRNAHLRDILFERYRGLSFYYFEVLFALGKEEEYAKACSAYDRWLKQEFPEIYANIRYHPIRLYRLMRYKAFSLAGLLK